MDCLVRSLQPRLGFRLPSLGSLVCVVLPLSLHKQWHQSDNKGDQAHRRQSRVFIAHGVVLFPRTRGDLPDRWSWSWLAAVAVVLDAKVDEVLLLALPDALYQELFTMVVGEAW